MSIGHINGESQITEFFLAKGKIKGFCKMSEILHGSSTSVIGSCS